MNAATDVRERTSLPPNVRDHLLDCPRKTWSGHPLFDGKAAFFIGYHDFIRAEAARLKRALEELLNGGVEFDGPSIGEASAIGKNLVHYTEHHHKIEDACYFPHFVQSFPSLRAGIELLDNDHRVLEHHLHELQRALSIEHRSRVEYGHVALAYDRAEGVAQVLTRHLFDEEEIIIPMFLDAA